MPNSVGTKKSKAVEMLLDELRVGEKNFSAFSILLQYISARHFAACPFSYEEMTPTIFQKKNHHHVQIGSISFDQNWYLCQRKKSARNSTS